ncbi:alpha/beta fold hydrolase [Pseudomonas sp. N040]|uniref:alpha/beta fold hydrolase n=1 Tax=Pseudomonas sp. N040 TaxID=2785325 RepID=UPI0018A26532|nr:alpha/beta hydrolase [Pseudomonas sp. N040]MBF7729838.1 alpha/beta hydrolase [Pseudomonas sp. N040]MBW7013480.1 alpha/beta hydrolase [Pseudomonas sp. N040]
MRAHTAIVIVNRQYRIYTEFHYNPAATRTILLVNGSLATTAAFAHTVKYLLQHFNVALYDQPYAGGSKAHNEQRQAIGRDDEAEILLQLIEHFQASLLLSFSWGGIASLLALAQRPPLIEKAVIASFSPVLNAATLDYLQRSLELLGSCARQQLASLVNDTLGQHLPALFKRYNHKHISSLEDYEYAQMHAHIEQLLRLQGSAAHPCFSQIEIPLQFINGELDRYTSATDARLFGGLVRDSQFAVIDNAGHFLDMENKPACQQMRACMLDFLEPPALPRRHPASVLLSA